MSTPHNGHAEDPAGGDRRGCSASVHACLDVLDKGRAAWAARSDDGIEVDIELFTAAPDARAADLLHGAALMIFLAERRAG